MHDFLLMAALGFLGSFGHCAGMCGPLATALAFADRTTDPSWQEQLRFHGLLNLGRLGSYVLVGAAIGAIASVLAAGGQLAGMGSGMRQLVALLSGLLLVAFGLARLGIPLFPGLPGLGRWHNWLGRAIARVAARSGGWMPLLLGALWGWMPCGFLFAAQLKAAETGSPIAGGATLLAFGLGTLPVMWGIGSALGAIGTNRRSQLSQLGGWLAVAIGLAIMARNGNPASDFTGHGSLLLLGLALLARPVARVWPLLLRCRRALGVGACLLAIAHTFHAAEHTLGWNARAIAFLLPGQRWGLWFGMAALGLLVPLASTSFDGAMRSLGTGWRRLHLLSVPAWILAGGHALLVGSHYLGSGLAAGQATRQAILLAAAIAGVLLARSRWVWQGLGVGHRYQPPQGAAELARLSFPRRPDRGE